MNPVLVICLSLSVLTGLSAAVGAVLAGLGWLAAFAIYSVVGSLSLVVSAMIARPGAQRSAPLKARR